MNNLENAQVTDYCDCGDCSDTPIEQRPAPIGQDGEKITSVFFEGQQWTPRDGGTYQAVRVWANGRLLGCVGMGYGYYTQYETNALDWLAEVGIISDEQANRPAWKLQEHGVTVYSSLAHVGKRELVKSNNIVENIARFAPIN